MTVAGFTVRLLRRVARRPAAADVGHQGCICVSPVSGARDDEPAWLVALRAEWADRLEACGTLVAAGQIHPVRLETLRARMAWELQHPELTGAEERFNAIVSHREGRPPVHTPNPAEDLADLESLKALAERRRLAAAGEPTPVPAGPDDGLPRAVTSPWAAALVRAMHEQADVYERGFDAQLAADIARREREVWTLRLRGLLRPQRTPRPLPVMCRGYAGQARPRPRRRRPGCRARSPGRQDDPDPLSRGAAA